MDHVVLDVEIQKTIEETPGGWDATDKLGVSVAVLYEFRSDRFRIYGPDDVPALRERLLAADQISGYNIWRFDFPVIWGIPRRETPPAELAPKTNDMLLRIWDSQGLSLTDFSRSHAGWKLDDVAGATLGTRKSGNGADAPKWWQAGLWARVTDYCVDDVRIERDLAIFMDRYGYVTNGVQTVRLKPHPELLPQGKV